MRLQIGTSSYSAPAAPASPNCHPPSARARWPSSRRSGTVSGKKVHTYMAESDCLPTHFKCPIHSLHHHPWPAGIRSLVRPSPSPSALPVCKSPSSLTFLHMASRLQASSPEPLVACLSLRLASCLSRRPFIFPAFDSPPASFTGSLPRSWPLFLHRSENLLIRCLFCTLSWRHTYILLIDNYTLITDTSRRTLLDLDLRLGLRPQTRSQSR